MLIHKRIKFCDILILSNPIDSYSYYSLSHWFIIRKHIEIRIKYIYSIEYRHRYT